MPAGRSPRRAGVRRFSVFFGTRSAVKSDEPGGHRARSPADPVKLKLLRGNPGKRAIRPEPEPTLLTEPPAPPRNLRGDALDEWGRVTRELIRLGMLTVLDLRPLAAYCQVFGRWMAAEDTLALTAMPATDHLTYVVARNGEPHSPRRSARNSPSGRPRPACRRAAGCTACARPGPPNSPAWVLRPMSSWPSPATSHCPRFSGTPTNSIGARRPMPPWPCSKPEQNCKTRHPGFTISAFSC